MQGTGHLGVLRVCTWVADRCVHGQAGQAGTRRRGRGRGSTPARAPFDRNVMRQPDPLHPATLIFC